MFQGHAHGRRIEECAVMNSGQASCSTSAEAEQTAVREHLEAILSHHVFRNSKRYAAVLRYIVEQSLDGAGAQLKERTIGIEVFGRSLDYDTANDHVVRSAMSEVRKRLAQFYREEGSQSDLKIEIQPGSYVPHFRSASQAILPQHGHALLNLPLHEARQVSPRWPWRIWSLRKAGFLGAAALILIATVASYEYPADPIQAFWAPVFSSRGPALLCVGTLGQGMQSTNASSPVKSPITLTDFHDADAQLVHIDDAITFAQLAGLLQQNKKPYRLASQSEANFADLQNGPAVLVGLMNNDWTERLISNLRFTVERDSGGSIWFIRDRQNPSNRDWSINYSVPYLDVNKDYALLLRVRDPKTDQIVVVAAGLSAFGTAAAGKFLTDPNDMKKLAAIAPKGWETKNMEIVLSTEVIRGTSGHATVVASQFW
jgi:hypothetical protein